MLSQQAARSVLDHLSLLGGQGLRMRLHGTVILSQKCKTMVDKALVVLCCKITAIHCCNVLSVMISCHNITTMNYTHLSGAITSVICL